MSPMNIAGFVISLERATARRPQVERILQLCPIPCRKLTAVDGAALSQSDLDAVYRPQLLRPHYILRLSRGEIGCFLSHRRAWQQIVDEGLAGAFIIEDDMEITPSFQATWDFALKVMQPGDYIKFPVRKIGGGSQRIFTDGIFTLVLPTVGPLDTRAQLVTREAAKRLLQATSQFDRPVDTTLQMTWVTGVPISVVLPPVLREISATIGGSTLSSRRKTFRDRLVREVWRPIYRLRIAALSRRHSKRIAG